MTCPQQHDSTVERTAQRAWFIEVLSALNRLHPADGEVVRLTYMSGLTRSAIARHLGVPEATVGSMLARGMRALGDDVTGWRPPARL